MLCGILDVLCRRNCAVRLLHLRAPEAAPDLLAQYKLDGCVWYLPDAALFPRITKLMRQCAIPVVVPIMSYTPADLSGLPPNHFAHDFPAVGRVRTDYLLGRGHRRIAYCASTQAGPYAGFTAALAGVGMAQNPDWNLPRVDDIPRRLPCLLDASAVTAIICDGGRNRIESVLRVLDGHRWRRQGELLLDFIGGALAEVTAAFPRVKVTAVNFYAHQEIGRGAAEALVDAVRDGRPIQSVRYASTVRPPTWSSFHKRGEMPLQDRTVE
ncbi:MAG: hypothetical protein A3K19_19890 [Lentisphaerae bacterium RIFOXYB12_FULL_65_16]|nr:MAG: hypothetical protein A3K18_07170 [Lentisphaerae bacterium RIFOXYA12_64_32]OGV85072.1 MAG: hypothetical protein A3K19_19890 [Lentisphaerae bacterium RIFOXYB12_FULL_65_16]